MANMLQILPPTAARNARIALALRIRIHRLKDQRRALAQEWVERQNRHDAVQEYLLDQICADSIMLRRFRSLVHQLEGVAP
jgi:hypothetical protein